MNEDAESGLRFLDALNNFAERIKDIGLALYEVEFDSLCFGSFSVVFGKRKKRFKATWDGREFFLDLFQADVPDSRIPVDWKHASNRRLEPAPFAVIFDAIGEQITKIVEPAAGGYRGPAGGPAQPQP